MPRTSIVPRDDAIAMVEKFIDHFMVKPYPQYTSVVWKDMSEFLKGRWTPHNVYVNVRNNRRAIVSTACANKGIPFDVPANFNCNDTTQDPTINDSVNVEVTNDSDDSEVEYAGLDEFKVHITNEEWKSIQPSSVQYADRKYPILKKGVWTDVLSLAIYKQTQLPCAFVFKNSKVYVTPGSLQYVRIKGHCKSKKCGNVIFCYINEDPGDAVVDITIKTRDTMYDNHEDVKRPLRGRRRQEVGKAVFYEGCGNWQKQIVVQDTKIGERVPMHIPNLDVLRQAKLEFVNNKLDVKPSDGKDIINTIEKMKHIAPYHGFINEIRRDKFYVSFGTPAQLYAYKQYCKTVKTKATLSVDGTGSIVQPLTRYDGSQSGHIFLYSIVINFDHTTLSVYDLLTESQETDVFWWWLNHWLKSGAPKPAYAICDYSRALLNGMSLAFNQQTIKAYVETCFLLANRNEEYYYRPPVNTYIRLDVAHVMAMVRRWKCIKEIRHTTVQQFFLYCVAMMIDCQTLEQFRDIFSLTCTVALHAFQDSEIQTIHNGTVNDCRKKLEGYIAARNFDYDFDDKLADSDENRYGNANEDKDKTNRSRIKEWIDKIHSTSEITKKKGTEPNPFYCDDFVLRFMPLAYEFPLWTSVGIPHNVQRGTSTFSEGHFNDLKHRVLRNYPRPLRADKFLKLEFQDNNGGATILLSNLRNFKQSSCPPFSSTPLPKKSLNTDSEDQFPAVEDAEHISSQLSSYNAADSENNNEPTINNKNHSPQTSIPQNTNVAKKMGKYFRPQPDIQHQHNRATNIRKLWLLRNGNDVQHSALINGKRYFAYHTCAWDSIIQILSNSAMDDPQYLRSLELSSNKTLEFVKKFVKTGPSAALYSERVRVLKPLFETKIKAKFDNNLLTSYTINLWDNVAAIWKACFYSDPSASDFYYCQKCGTSIVPIFTLSVNHKMIGERGFLSLQDALESVNHTRKLQCHNNNCSQMYTVNRNYDTQIFIELDIRPTLSPTQGMSCKLREFPLTLDLNGHQYRLAGIVAHLPGHYIAYCRRGNNFWEMCNDMNTKVVHASANTQMEPHGVIYTKMITGNESLPNIPSLPHQSVETEYFPVKAPLEDSDIISHDNWRNKGDNKNIYYDSGADENNNSESSPLKKSESRDEIPTMSIDGETFQILECYSITS